MSAETTLRLRRVWLQIHLWLGIGLAILLVPVSLSGAALVWHDHLDALVNPARYTVTAGRAAAAVRAHAARGRALEPGFQPTAVRMPESAGWPATVMAREPRRGEGGEGRGC